MRLGILFLVLASVFLLLHHHTDLPATRWADSDFDKSDFRRTIATIRPSDTLSGRRAARMGAFDDIFVISLRKRADRRARMERIREALGLEWEYVFATQGDDPAMIRVMEQLRAVRANTTEADFEWPPNTLPDIGETVAFPMTGGETWHLDPSDSRAPPQLPDPPMFDNRPQLMAYGGEYRAPVGGTGLGMIPARVATFYSHMSLLRRIADAPYANHTALIMEDDVDIEFSITRRLARIFGSGAIPHDWDMLYLGHCPSENPLGGESHSPTVSGAPEIRPSWDPYCTHAYAVSRDGARRMLTQMR